MYYISICFSPNNTINVYIVLYRCFLSQLRQEEKYALYYFFNCIITFTDALFFFMWISSGIACDIWSAIYIISYLFVKKKTKQNRTIYGNDAKGNSPQPFRFFPVTSVASSVIWDNLKT